MYVFCACDPMTYVGQVYAMIATTADNLNYILYCSSFITFPVAIAM